MRYGPSRARTLTIEGLRDPRLGQDIRPLWGIPSTLDVRDAIKDELAKAKEGASAYQELKALIESQAKDAGKGEVAQAIADLRRQSDRLSAKLDNPPALSVSPEVEDRIVRAVRSRVSQVLEEQVGRLQQGGTAPGGMPDPSAHPEAYLAYLQAQQNQAVWSGMLQERGVDPYTSQALARGGEQVIRLWMAQQGIDPREVLG